MIEDSSSRDVNEQLRRRAGFPRRLRVRKRAEFLRVQASSTKASGRHLLALLDAPAQGQPLIGRLGITVSRKVGNAVVRNRVKRWLREIFRRHMAQREEVAGGFDLVIIARPSAALAGFELNRQELVRLMDRLLEAGSKNESR